MNSITETPSSSENLQGVQEWKREEILKNLKKWESTKYKNDGDPSFRKIPKEDARKAAEEYWEWCESLTNFLEICIKNGIVTTGSCAGHPEKWRELSYVMFDITDERTKDFIEFVVENKLADELHMWKKDKKAYWIEFKDGENKEVVHLTLVVSINRRDEMYNIWTKRIKEHIEEHKMGKKERNKESESLIRKLMKIEGEYKLKKSHWCYMEYSIKENKVRAFDNQTKELLQKSKIDFENA